MRLLTVRTGWSVAAKLVGLALFGFSLHILLSLATSMFEEGRELSEWLMIALMALLLLALACVVSWVGWRLWRHWNAGTVRLATILLLVMAALFGWGSLAELEGRSGFPWKLVSGFVLMILPFVMALAYRRIVPFVLRNAQLDDPVEPSGKSAGHMKRVHLFSAALGLSIWIGGTQMALALAATPSTALFAILSLAAGVVAERIALWWLTPPPAAPLPPGRGFEVVPTDVPRS